MRAVHYDKISYLSCYPPANILGKSFFVRWYDQIRISCLYLYINDNSGDKGGNFSVPMKPNVSLS